MILVYPGVTAGVTLLRKTRTIPVVFLISFDPIQEGLVTSIAHPGGNATGFTVSDPSIAGKLPPLLKEIAPNVTRAMHLFGPGWSSTPALVELFTKYSNAIERGAQSSAIAVHPLAVSSNEEIERGLATFAQQPDGGLVITPDSFLVARRAYLVALAARFRLPAAYSARFYAVDGGLISYGGDQVDYFRQPGDYVDRILRGTKPAYLPVQTPKKFELVINLQTAKALGLTIPPALLARADEVVE